MFEAIATDFFFFSSSTLMMMSATFNDGDRASKTSHRKWGSPLKQQMRMKVWVFGGGTEETPPSLGSGVTRPLGYRSVSLQCNRQVCGEETSSALTSFWECSPHVSLRFTSTKSSPIDYRGSPTSSTRKFPETSHCHGYPMCLQPWCRESKTHSQTV